MGHDAISERKLESGNPLTILGVSTQLTHEGVWFSPDEAKILKWTSQIRRALDQKRLTPGEAAKLAGSNSTLAANVSCHVMCVEVASCGPVSACSTDWAEPFYTLSFGTSAEGCVS